MLRELSSVNHVWKERVPFVKEKYSEMLVNCDEADLYLGYRDH